MRVAYRGLTVVMAYEPSVFPIRRIPSISPSHPAAGLTLPHPTANVRLQHEQRCAGLVVNHRDFDRLEPLVFKRLAYVSSQAAVPHQGLMGRDA